MSLVNMPSSFWRMLASRFYQKGTRDDGLWHLIRDPDAAWWVNGQVIASGATWTSGNILGVRQVPPHAVGVILSCAFTSATAGARVYVYGQAAPLEGASMPLGDTQVASKFCRQWVASLFRLTAGVPNGTVTFAAWGGQCTVYATPIGYIA